MQNIIILFLTNLLISVFSVFVVHFSFLDNYKISSIWNLLKNYRYSSNNKLKRKLNTFLCKENIIFFILFFLLNIFVYVYLTKIASPEFFLENKSLVLNNDFFSFYNFKFLRTYIIFYSVLLASFIDIRYRFFPNFLFFLMLFVVFLSFAFSGSFVSNIFNFFYCVIVLLFIYLFGKIVFKKEAFGMGDIEILLCLGMLYKVKWLINLLFLSFFICSIFICFYVCFNKFFLKKDKKEFIPFIPFIFLAIFISKNVIFFN